MNFQTLQNWFAGLLLEHFPYEESTISGGFLGKSHLRGHDALGGQSEVLFIQHQNQELSTTSDWGESQNKYWVNYSSNVISL